MDLKDLFYHYLAKQDGEVTVVPQLKSTKKTKSNNAKKENKIITVRAPVLIDPTQPRNQEDWDET